MYYLLYSNLAETVEPCLMTNHSLTSSVHHLLFPILTNFPFTVQPFPLQTVPKWDIHCLRWFYAFTVTERVRFELFVVPHDSTTPKLHKVQTAGDIWFLVQETDALSLDLSVWQRKLTTLWLVLVGGSLKTVELFWALNSLTDFVVQQVKENLKMNPWTVPSWEIGPGVCSGVWSGSLKAV